MGTTVGILTPAQEQQLATLLDNLVVLKGILNLVKGFVFKALITFLDNNVIDKLPENVKTVLSDLVNAVLGGDVPLAEAKANELVNALNEIKPDTSELLLAKGSLELFAGTLLDKVDKLKGQQVKLTLK